MGQVSFNKGLWYKRATQQCSTLPYCPDNILFIVGDRRFVGTGCGLCLQKTNPRHRQGFKYYLMINYFFKASAIVFPISAGLAAT
jgi:hypothetical protein